VEEQAADTGAVPDLVVFGKGAGAGFAPVAGVLVRTRVAEALTQESGRRGGPPVLHQQSYGGNPISCAVGRAVLRALRAEGAFDRARRIELKLRETLAAVVGIPNSAIDAFGALAGFESPLPDLARRAAERGLLLHAADAPRVVVAPPLTMGAAEWNEFRASLEAVVRDDARG